MPLSVRFSPTDSFIRKDKPIGQALDSAFSLDQALDAAADVFNGVSGLHWS